MIKNPPDLASPNDSSLESRINRDTWVQTRCVGTLVTYYLRASLPRLSIYMITVVVVMQYTW